MFKKTYNKELEDDCLLRLYSFTSYGVFQFHLFFLQISFFLTAE